jgi:hypothetical protein
MKTNSLPEEADALLARAQAIATVLSEKREEVGISTEVEALLRASIEAATFAIDRYVAVVAGANKSPVAMGYVAEAKAGCNRSIRQLRRRVNRAVAELSRLMGQKEARKAARYMSRSA